MGNKPIVSSGSQQQSNINPTSRTTTTTAMSSSAIGSTVSLGAGCYWGTEKYIKVEFEKMFPGSIKSARVGFMSPEKDHPKNPSYRQVCTGTTGHVEVLQVELNDPISHFEELIKYFFCFHDPTTLDRQGNDTGSQYASAIFVSDDHQKEVAEKVMSDLQSYITLSKSPYSGKKIATKIHDINEFYQAQESHQEYLMKNPNGYCNHYLRLKKWPLN